MQEKVSLSIHDSANEFFIVNVAMGIFMPNQKLLNLEEIMNSNFIWVKQEITRNGIRILQLPPPQ